MLRRHVAASVLLPLFIALVPPLTGCAGEARSALGYTENAKRAYDAAMVEFDAHNWLESQTLFREVKKKYSYSRYARLAELRIADADFAQEKYPEAIREYKQFVHDHRSETEEIAYARSKIADAQYSEINDSFLLPASEERDQASTLEAYRELRSYVHDYPESKEGKHVCDLLGDVTIKLVRHELTVARYYLARENFAAALLRGQYALKNFLSDSPCPSSSSSTRSGLAQGAKDGSDPGAFGPPPPPPPEYGLAPEALLLLGETYLKMHHYTDARLAFRTLLEQYKASALTRQALDYLGFMQSHGV